MARGLHLSKIDGEIQIFDAVLEDEFHGEDCGLNWIAEIEPSENGDESIIPDASESGTGMGSPPITEDDRRVEPASPDLHTQGGSSMPKLPEEDSMRYDKPNRMPTLPDVPHWAKDMQEEK